MCCLAFPVPKSPCTRFRAIFVTSGPAPPVESVPFLFTGPHCLRRPHLVPALPAVGFSASVIFLPALPRKPQRLLFASLVPGGTMKYPTSVQQAARLSWFAGMSGLRQTIRAGITRAWDGMTSCGCRTSATTRPAISWRTLLCSLPGFISSKSPAHSTG